MVTQQDTWTELLGHLDQLATEDVESIRFQSLIEQLPMAIDRLVLYSDYSASRIPTTSLVHYTSWGRALAILKDGHSTMRKYHYELANDPKEGEIVAESWKPVYEDANSWIDGWWKKHGNGEDSPIRGGNAFGCSFSSNGIGVEDKLAFWRFYGNDGDGCSFKVSQSIFGEYHTIYRVRYRDSNGVPNSQREKQEDRFVEARIRQLLDKGKEIAERAEGAGQQSYSKIIVEAVCKVFGGYRHLIKNKQYADEQEWRMIEVMPERVKFDDRNDLVRRYVEGLPWRKLLASKSVITVGPGVSNQGAAIEYVRHLVQES